MMHLHVLPIIIVNIAFHVILLTHQTTKWNCKTIFIVRTSNNWCRWRQFKIIYLHVNSRPGCHAVHFVACCWFWFMPSADLRQWSWAALDCAPTLLPLLSSEGVLGVVVTCWKAGGEDGNGHVLGIYAGAVTVAGKRTGTGSQGGSVDRLLINPPTWVQLMKDGLLKKVKGWRRSRNVAPQCAHEESC